MAKRRLTMMAVVLGLSTQASQAYLLNPSDFATEVVQYIQGSGVTTDVFSGKTFNDPATALGRPTVDTTGDGMSMPLGAAVPVVPVYGAFRAHELVSVGQGGSLTVKFDHRVMNDPGNPYGLDLIVFGNAAGAGNDYWANGDPNAMQLGRGIREEKGIVSVSQDGEHWYTFANGPFADDSAPTLGRIYAPEEPVVGQWWGEPTNPTLPLDPTLTEPSLTGKTVAEIAQLYGHSAGGTGFDIGSLGLEWIQYVRIENPEGSGVTPDIDAFADVAAIPEPGWLGVGIGIVMLMRRRR
ncbi:MAG: hypothetical protein ACM359_11135 [Bacillota bacterium]